MGKDGERVSNVAEALEQFRRLASRTSDEEREELVAVRHSKGFRTARENLADLCDPGSFTEYGQLAVAAQKQRRDFEYLRTKTAADGVITGIGTVNADCFGNAAARTGMIVNDYTALAATQGYYHHKKIDRLLEVLASDPVPVIMYSEGGGGRPGDTDVVTMNSGLDVRTFASWARLRGKAPRIAVNNGYCFAGSAVLFGMADFRIATKSSWIGMAGPAMIEGGGLGKFAPTDIGPIDVLVEAGVVDVCAQDEADATRIAKQLLGYFQGRLNSTGCADQTLLRSFLPDDRRFSYKMRDLIAIIADMDSFLELTPGFGGAIITGLIRIEGAAVAVIASDSRVLGGAIDSDAARKVTRFLSLCNMHGLPVVSLVDTPGFMVGPRSEAQGAVWHMTDLMLAGATLDVPLVSVVVRKAYGLGSQAMAWGGFKEPLLSVSWPTGEFGGMGIEGAVKLGFRKELEAEEDEGKRDALFEQFVLELYDKGRATEVATVLEIDAVIDPADTRSVIARALGLDR